MLTVVYRYSNVKRVNS